jgi:hypothetical protein
LISHSSFLAKDQRGLTGLSCSFFFTFYWC